MFLDVGYSWHIRGVFGEYSWDIHMYRVCVGYVSGMYRESVEAYKERRAKGELDKAPTLCTGCYFVRVKKTFCIIYYFGGI